MNALINGRSNEKMFSASLAEKISEWETKGLSEEFTGYRGQTLNLLKSIGAEIGDVIRVTKGGETWEGILIPRSEIGDEHHVVIKMKSGYNVGVRIDSEAQIEKVGTGVKPTFTPPPIPEQNKSLPRVAIVSTGGTIASRVDYRTGGVRPALSASELYSVVPELSDIAMVDTEILFSVYSENITAKHWIATAKAVAKHIERGVDGVVVAHGTDTLGYSAAALSFALQDLPVPVVLVASQRSADRPSSDAATNLVGAVKAAVFAPFAEVVIAMHETVSDTSIVFHRGTKARKCHTSRRDTFKSVNASPLARMADGKIRVLTKDYMKRDAKRKLKLNPNFDKNVALVKAYPDVNPELIDWYVQKGIKGIIFEGTGLGHVGDYLFSAIKNATEKGVIVCMTSQCIWGRLNMNVYDQGRDILSLGVISLDDMLPETAYVKLRWVLGQTADAQEAKMLLKENLVHEYSARTLYDNIGI
ncbi:MAG: Glu-tRNA(Gln) amidotransferase subunit GatD [Candidatus Bathyarchaeota archaeon]|nr:Glu-tRNA(Gln) amidotransferase subunit GatD [Candidatus Bathyarchaeum sp.]